MNLHASVLWKPRRVLTAGALEDSQIWMVGLCTMNIQPRSVRVSLNQHKKCFQCFHPLVLKGASAYSFVAKPDKRRGRQILLVHLKWHEWKHRGTDTDVLRTAIPTQQLPFCPSKSECQSSLMHSNYTITLIKVKLTGFTENLLPA